jgi:cytoskeletal protein CcmA (bactofilin family)
MIIIGRSIRILGDLTSDEDLLIEGSVRGQILMRDKELTIGEGAHVQADVRVGRITVLGRVTGNVAATERIELRSSADVNGNLSANHVVVADGACFNGRIDMDHRTIAAKVAKYRASLPVEKAADA